MSSEKLPHYCGESRQNVFAALLHISWKYNLDMLRFYRSVYSRHRRPWWAMWYLFASSWCLVCCDFAVGWWLLAVVAKFCRFACEATVILMHALLQFESMYDVVWLILAWWWSCTECRCTRIVMQYVLFFRAPCLKRHVECAVQEHMAQVNCWCDECIFFVHLLQIDSLTERLLRLLTMIFVIECTSIWLTVMSKILRFKILACVSRCSIYVWLTRGQCTHSIPAENRDYLLL